MPDTVFFLWLGIHIPEMTAGFAGGSCSAVFLSRAKPSQFLASMIVGALTANYMSAVALKMVGLAINVGESGGTSAFLTGFLATPILQFVYSQVQKRVQTPTPPNGGI